MENLNHYSEYDENIDISKHPKKIIELDFILFGNRESTKRDSRTYERDESGRLYLKQTKYNRINVSVYIFSKSFSFSNTQILNRRFEISPLGEKRFHYTIKSKKDSLVISLLINEYQTEVELIFHESSSSKERVQYHFAGVKDIGYSDYDPYFTSVFKKYPANSKSFMLKSSEARKADLRNNQLANQKANEFHGSLTASEMFSQLPDGEFKNKLKRKLQVSEQKIRERDENIDHIEQLLHDGLKTYLEGYAAGAERDFLKILEIEPEIFNANEYLGLIEMNLRQNFTTAEKYYLRALESPHNEGQTLFFLGILRLKQNKPVEAEIIFRQGIETKQNIYNMYNGLADALMQQNKGEEAALNFRLAADFNNERRLPRDAIEKLMLEAERAYIGISPPEENSHLLK